MFVQAGVVAIDNRKDTSLLTRHWPLAVNYESVMFYSTRPRKECKVNNAKLKTAIGRIIRIGKGLVVLTEAKCNHAKCQEAYP